MGKRSFIGVLVASTVWVSACTGEIGEFTAAPREAAPEATIVPALSVSDGWRSIEGSEPAYDTLEFEVVARPTAWMDAGIALASGDSAGPSAAPINVRFTKSGSIEVQNGDAWEKAASVSYRPRHWYRIVISADLAKHTYDVGLEQYTGPPKKRLAKLVTGAAFGTSASDSLTTWFAWSSEGAELEIAEASWVVSGSCAPATCQSLGVDCGEPTDGCGGTLRCGGCASGQTCESGVCACTRESCLSLGVECGSVPDGCGGTLTCGECPSGEFCSDGVCMEVAAPSPTQSCVPETCLSRGLECSIWSDGCGGTLNCGGCPSGQACSLGTCVDTSPPPAPSCVPETCLSRGLECGTLSDGCGGTLSCGGCASGQTCTSGVCVNLLPPNTCTADCAGKQCGDDGCGGSCGTCSGSETCNNISGQCVEPVGLIWTDSIQPGGQTYGFDAQGTNHPLGTSVPPGDANGANLSRVPDPLGGSGYALRQYGFLEDGGARSQLGLYSFLHPEFEALALSGEPVYAAQEWYFPEGIEAGGDSAPWLNLFDWHTTADNGQSRWHTDPGMMLNEDGSMTFRFEWGAGAQLNPTSGWSRIALPVGEWFDIEVRWQFATSSTATVSVWINGELALEQAGVVTGLPEHSRVEFYVKLYGSNQGGTPWSPRGTLKYVRNVRISGQRIWR